MLVLSTDGVEFVQEGLIGHGARPQALLVQHGQDPVLVLKENKGRRGKRNGKKMAMKTDESAPHILLAPLGLHVVQTDFNTSEG